MPMRVYSQKRYGTGRNLRQDVDLSAVTGVTTIKVRVTSQDDDTATIADYTIRVTRKARVVGTDATLSTL